MKKFAKMAVAAAIAGMAMGAQAGLVVDDFTVGQGLDSNSDFTLFDKIVDGFGKYNSVTGAATSILGGERDIFIQKIGIGNNAIGQVTTYVDQNAPGVLAYSTGAQSSGQSSIRWDGVNGSSAVASGTQGDFDNLLNPTGLGGLNLKLNADAFQIVVKEADLGFTFSMTVFSSATSWTTLLLASVDHNNYIPESSPILFSDFEGTSVGCQNPLAPCAAPSASGAFYFTGTGSADLTNVGALVAQINFTGAETKIDLEIDDVITVPEPASLGLVGLALLALGAVRRRKTSIK